MHARMLCINAPLQLCNKQRSEEAPSKDHNKPILKHSRRRTEPCCRNRRLPSLLQATVKYKEYMLLHYLDTDSSWRKGEIYIETAVTEDGPSYRHHRSPAFSTRCVNISLMGTVPRTISAPRDRTVCTSVP
jgi:hypothetical protein